MVVSGVGGGGGEGVYLAAGVLETERLVSLFCCWVYGYSGRDLPEGLPCRRPWPRGPSWPSHLRLVASMLEDGCRGGQTGVGGGRVHCPYRHASSRGRPCRRHQDPWPPSWPSVLCRCLVSHGCAAVVRRGEEVRGCPSRVCRVVRTLRGLALPPVSPC